MAGKRTVRREISTAKRADARLPFFDFLRDESSTDPHQALVAVVTRVFERFEEWVGELLAYATAELRAIAA
jgi:hypothetical protein